jgi:hypothetical protein
MKDLSLPFHLIVPCIISLAVIALLLYHRKRLFKSGKHKWLWISLTVFFTLYLLIVGRSLYLDIYYELALQKFDLNGDGFFNGNEITTELKEALKRLSSDTGRNFSFITGLIFSGIISFFVFVIGKLIEKIKNRKKTHSLT